ncbi:DNA-binding transcriptional regulator, GntR family [Cupriavidus sp. YR651]|uniref:GntR family transcriptional regulator n=1 Tax=Cupriavidus sp. YR651 TaxID=1855315 RepID=UPI00088B600C|nr:GntR family transcriptional regulator [Cupriavidus sp. YR651]SDD72935.1 DNA-binding transcriptional regulator, GntR family [Cupriavidus sp. YR651]
MTANQDKPSADIAQRITEAMLAQKLLPGSRLGEQELAALFGVSRTLVREALMRLAARGMVTVSSRRGWYLIEPGADDIRAAFDARRIIETGLLRDVSKDRPPSQPAIHALKVHIAREKAALDGDDAGARSFLLGDFHVCLCASLGHGLLVDTLRDLTARTTLVASRQQSATAARRSCAQHEDIVNALAAGDGTRAARLMAAHLHEVHASLSVVPPEDPLAQLRHALAPVSDATSLTPSTGSPQASGNAAPAPQPTSRVKGTTR